MATTTIKRVLPAVGLFLLSPLVAEFLLGNMPINQLASLLVLAPLYGGGAVLIREAVRRTGRGWPSILILALAYGVLEEGVATMSLFNPNYAGAHLLDSGFVPLLGIGVPWTILVLTLHVVWSIGVPIALVEALVPERRTTPWLRRAGLIVTSVLFVLGFAGITAISIAQSQFIAPAPQLVSSVVLGAALVVLGLVVVPRQTAQTPIPGSAPNPWLVGIAAFVVSSAFKVLPQEWPAGLYAVVALAIGLLAIVGVSRWSRHLGWTDMHRLALAAGPLLTYAWTAFPQPPVLPASETVDLIGNAVFAIAAIVLVSVAAIRLRRRPVAAAEPTSEVDVAVDDSFQRRRSTYAA